MVFPGKMYGKIFYAMNNFWIANFSLFVIEVWKYIFKAIMFIHAAFIHKIKVVLKILIRGIRNMPLILYFSHIFIFNTVLERNYGRIVLKINVYFYLTVPFCLKHNNIVYRWKAYVKTNKLTYNILQSVAKCESNCILGIIKLTKIPPRPSAAMWMN